MGQSSSATIHTDCSSLVELWENRDRQGCPRWLSDGQFEAFGNVFAARPGVEVVWVKGHSESVGNRLVDVLSRTVSNDPAGRGVGFEHGWVADVEMLQRFYLVPLTAQWLAEEGVG